jgi:hypothetical protein
MSDGEETNPLDSMNMVDVYAAGSPMEADRISALLADEGIEPMTREVSVSEFPSTATQRFLILTAEGDKERAQALIRQAIADGVLPSDGSFL